MEFPSRERYPMECRIRRINWMLGAVICAASRSPAVAQLGPPPVPPENPITPEKTVLGKILFWDEQLSSDNTVACGTCHQPRQGGADPGFMRLPGRDGVLNTPDDTFGSPGVRLTDGAGYYLPALDFGFDPQVTGRLAPTFIGASYFTTNFWDGRAPTTFIDPLTGAQSIASGGALESQLVKPPVSAVEMAHPGRTWIDVERKLIRARPLALASDLPNDVATAIARYPGYPALFRRAFGTNAITTERIAFAIATYERSLVPDQSPWDDFDAGHSSALTPGQLRGLNLFNGKGRCVFCHVPPLFADDSFHNIGVRPPHEDLGLRNVTGSAADRGRFKTPTLRNTGLRQRWMHNGNIGDLDDVVDFYVKGGNFSDNLDPLIGPLSINQFEKADLVDFLTHALTDPRVAAEEAPFDRPRLRSESPPNPELYGDASSGSGGFTPQMLADTPPNLGNTFFKIGVFDGLGGASAWVAIAADAAPPGTTINGVPINIATVPSPFLFPVTLQGVGDGEGYGTVIRTISRDPAIAGQDWYAQWFVNDPVAAGGLAASVGAKFTLY